MFQKRFFVDCYGRPITYTIWVPGPRKVVRKFLDRSKAWRPLQQRARDQTAKR